MKFTTLSDGNIMPHIGLGTYKISPQDNFSPVEFALRNGYRLIDTAEMYENENEVRTGIEKSSLRREEIFLTSKVWKTNMRYEETLNSFNKTLKNLSTDYLNLYLIHWPAKAETDLHWQETNQECWRALEFLKNEKKIKSIGVSNFGIRELQELLDKCEIKPVVNQIEFHPGYWDKQLLTFCKENGIQLQAWSPLARGRIFKENAIIESAEKHGKTPAQICLRWIIQKGVVPIPKSNTPERIKENFDVFDFELSAEELKKIDEIPEIRFQ